MAKSYSLAGKRAEAYALYSRALSLAEDALKKLQSTANKEQVSTLISVSSLHIVRCSYVEHAPSGFGLYLCLFVYRS